MKRLTYLSDNGGIVQFNGGGPYFLRYADLNSAGASFDEHTILGKDGVLTLGGSYNKKSIPASGQIVGLSKRHLEQLRASLALCMNIHFEGTLVAEQHDGSRKKIRVRPSGNPGFDEEKGLCQPFTLEWQSDTPYWSDYDPIILPIGQIRALWHFPFSTPILFGYAVADVEIRNTTSITIPTRIEILSQSTAVTITNQTTGEWLQVNEAIQEGQKMVIDSETADIYIQNLLTGEKTNATNRLEAGSTPITLSPGLNRIQLENGIAGSRPLSYIIYNKPCLAV